MSLLLLRTGMRLLGLLVLHLALSGLACAKAGKSFNDGLLPDEEREFLLECEGEPIWFWFSTKESRVVTSNLIFRWIDDFSCGCGERISLFLSSPLSNSSLLSRCIHCRWAGSRAYFMPGRTVL